jgi:hypothetical protein
VRIAEGFGGTTAVPITDPIVTAQGVISIRATATLGTGTFRDISSALQTSMGSGGTLVQSTLPVLGQLRYCLLFPGCGTRVLIGFGTASEATRHGVGGTRVQTFTHTTHNLFSFTSTETNLPTTAFGPWTVNGLMLVAGSGQNPPPYTDSGFAHGPASGTSTAAATSGVLQMISPIQTHQIIDVGNPSHLWQATFTRLRVRFLPEPGTPILLLTGALALLVLGRSRRRR